MLNRNKINLLIFYVLIILFIPISFIGAQNINIDFEPTVEKTFSTPDKTALLSEKSDMELLKEGYAKIGIITYEQVLKKCWPGDEGEECDSTIADSQHIKHLLDEVTERGGNLVVLTKKEEKFTRNIDKLECTHWTWRNVWRWKYFENAPAREVIEKEQYCARYEKLIGTETGITSVGTIWRKESELAKNQLYSHELSTAAEFGDINWMKRLFTYGIGVNTSYDGLLPITVAAQYGHIDAVKYLLAQGASLNSLDRIGTPLHGAAYGGQLEMVKFLIASGADVNIPNPYAPDFLPGTTPLHEAAHGGNVEVIQELISRGAEVDAKTEIGITPIMYAAGYGNTDAVIALADAGANVNSKSEEGISPGGEGAHLTALLWAVINVHIETILWLLVLDANIDEDIGEGITIMDFAKYNLDTYVFFLKYKDGTYGIIDTTGRIVRKPSFLKLGKKFSDGLVEAEFGGQSGYIDTTGKVVIRLMYGLASPFSEGLAGVRNGDYFYINKKGHEVTPHFNFLKGGFKNGVAMAVNSDRQEGLINKKGEFIVKSIWDCKNKFTEAVFIEDFLADDEWQWLLIDKNGGHKIIKCDHLYQFHDGFARIKKEINNDEKKYGFINTKGEIVIVPQFDGANDFSEGLAAIYKERRWGYIDTTGTIVIEPLFLFPGSFHNGLTIVLLADHGIHRYFIDKKGQRVIGPLRDGRDFNNGYAPVFFEGDSLYRVIDTKGNIVFSSRDNLCYSEFSEGLLVFKSTALKETIQALRKARKIGKKWK